MAGKHGRHSPTITSQQIGSNGMDYGQGFAAVALVIGLYFAPLIIAALRHADAVSSIALVNIFFGWSGAGWLWALIWALCGKTEEVAELQRRALRRAAGVE